jgi:hypothetical protein
MNDFISYEPFRKLWFGVLVVTGVVLMGGMSLTAIAFTRFALYATGVLHAGPHPETELTADEQLVEKCEAMPDSYTKAECDEAQEKVDAVDEAARRADHDNEQLIRWP